MIKKTATISINILSVLIILISVFMFSIKNTNAWFTAGNYKGIEIVATIGDLDVNLYQYEDEDKFDADSDSKEIFTMAENAKIEENKKSYINFAGEIKHDEEIPLFLKIKNDDGGSTSMYMRVKFELCQRGTTQDIPIPIEILGMSTCSIGGYGFKYNSDDEFYYYQYNVASDVGYHSSNNAEFAKGSEINLIEKFKIPYSSFVDASKNLQLTNSGTLFIRITIQGSIDDDFSNIT